MNPDSGVRVLTIRINDKDSVVESLIMILNERTEKEPRKLRSVNPVIS